MTAPQPLLPVFALVLLGWALATLPVDVSTLILAATLGALAGSFLNVCSIRWPEDRSIVRPPSSCPGCGVNIHWYDNIPLLGWVRLGGQCRGCSMRIPVRYVLVEVATAMLWAGIVAAYGIGWTSLTLILFLTLLFGIALSDAATYIIPDQFTVGGAGLGLALSFAPGGITPLASIIGLTVGLVATLGLGMAASWAFGKDALGGGDVKMMAMIGSFLGVGALAPTLFFGSLLGTIFFVPFAWKSGKLVPFGIFLALGAGTCALWLDRIAAAYLAWAGWGG